MKMVYADALDTLLIDCRNKYSTMLDMPIARTRADEIEAVRKTIREQLPIVEAEPVRHGRWLAMYELTSEGILPDEPMGYMCSQCNAKRKKRLNYCSNCGTKMDGDA